MPPTTPTIPPDPVPAGLSGPPWLYWLGWLVVFLGVFPGIVAYIVLAERKVAGRFQDRIGPNRVGPFGLLQPIADGIKLVTKESIVPRSADALVHLLAPMLLVISSFLVLSVIPFGVRSATRDIVPFGEVAKPRPLALVGNFGGPDSQGRRYGKPNSADRFGADLVADRPSRLDELELPFFQQQWYPALAAIDTASGLLILIAAASLAVLGVFLAGWSSRNKFALIGSMRGVAQLVSYEVPQVLALVPVILWTGSLSLGAIFNAQIDYGWFLWSPPGLFAFVTLLIAGIAETNRAPFDLPEAESEIVAGYHTEYSGMRFGLFFIGEYLAVFAICCLATALFLGGGTLPFLHWPLGSIDSVILVNLVLVPVFALKVAALIFVIFWVRATLPRMRVDRLMNFAWKVLVPLSLVNIAASAAWFEVAIRRDQHMLGWLVTIPPLLLALAVFTRLSKGIGRAPEIREQPSPRRRSNPSRVEARS